RGRHDAAQTLSDGPAVRAVDVTVTLPEGRTQLGRVECRGMTETVSPPVDQRTIGAPVVSLAMPRMRRQIGRLKDLPDGGEKKVLLAAPRGYCAGVDRAVVAVERALDRFGAPVYVRKQIVHNVHVVETLEKMGAVFVEELSEVPEGSHVVFSAHGVSPAVVSE